MEFRPYVTPERGACGGGVARVAMLSVGGALGFITFVLAAYAVSEVREMRDEMKANHAYPFLTLGGVKAGYAGVSAYRGAGSWHDQKPMPTAGISGVSDLQAVTGNHGNVYLFGGIDTAGTVLDRVLEYDVIRQTYATNTSLSAARARFGAGALTSASTGLVDRIVVAGGVDSSSKRDYHGRVLRSLYWYSFRGAGPELRSHGRLHGEHRRRRLHDGRLESGWIRLVQRF